MKTRNYGKMGCIAIKVDMSKVYDKVEWDFLKAMMGRLGFNRGWIELIMRCISSVSYVVLVNGQSGEVFYPSKGLRQGNHCLPIYFYCVLKS